MAQDGESLQQARHWIGGEWIDGGEPGQSLDPATGEPIGAFSEANRHVAGQEIAAAKDAFASSGWKDDRTRRARVLTAMADRFEARGEELVRLLGRENGKVHAHGRFETGIVPQTLRFNAALALTEHGRAAEIVPDGWSSAARRRSSSSTTPTWRRPRPRSCRRSPSSPASSA